MVYTLERMEKTGARWPAITEDGRWGHVNLHRWIKLVEESPRLREVKNGERERPTAIFTMTAGEDFEVGYALGLIMPVRYSEKSTVCMEELVQHLNEFVQSRSRPPEDNVRDVT